ncbi:hypothetical protein [Sphingobium quisquiliarum]|uniref:hypothetical protein n=1 Tax=Sphingobium quisquiliarum TaxID=538379 RepID=UPI0013766BB7|nr:hypothetical protein [Sphingobium quisquiliarum]
MDHVRLVRGENDGVRISFGLARIPYARFPDRLVIVVGPEKDLALECFKRIGTLRNRRELLGAGNRRGGKQKAASNKMSPVQHGHQAPPHSINFMFSLPDPVLVHWIEARQAPGSLGSIA